MRLLGVKAAVSRGNRDKTAVAAPAVATGRSPGPLERLHDSLRRASASLPKLPGGGQSRAVPRPALARIAPIKPRYLPLLAGFTITSTVLGLLTTPRSCPKATLWVGGTCFVNMAITTAAIVATSNMWNGTPEPPRRSPRA